uniref:Uncharacterized protein n=1 Tax=Escherichia coli TaxID=562 RepID=A0A7L8KBU8_ECOLX|nr:hypothetical protein [Escherichia coli]UCK65677.1 hypothetical protein [Providencia rettgeri]
MFCVCCCSSSKPRCRQRSNSKTEKKRFLFTFFSIPEATGSTGRFDEEKAKMAIKKRPLSKKKAISMNKNCFSNPATMTRWGYTLLFFLHHNGKLSHYSTQGRIISDHRGKASHNTVRGVDVAVPLKLVA